MRPGGEASLLGQKERTVRRRPQMPISTGTWLRITAPTPTPIAAQSPAATARGVRNSVWRFGAGVRDRRVGFFGFGWRGLPLGRIVVVPAVSTGAGGCGPAVAVARVQGARDRCTPPRTRRSSPPGRSSAAGRERPGVPCCSQPAVEQGEPAIVLYSSGHAARLASPACAETVDVRRTAPGSARDLRRDSCAGTSSCPGEPALGLPADRR